MCENRTLWRHFFILSTELFRKRLEYYKNGVISSIFWKVHHLRWCHFCKYWVLEKCGQNTWTELIFLNFFNWIIPEKVGILQKLSHFFNILKSSPPAVMSFLEMLVFRKIWPKHRDRIDFFEFFQRGYSGKSRNITNNKSVFPYVENLIPYRDFIFFYALWRENSYWYFRVFWRTFVGRYTFVHEKNCEFRPIWRGKRGKKGKKGEIVTNHGSGDQVWGSRRRWTGTLGPPRQQCPMFKKNNFLFFFWICFLNFVRCGRTTSFFLYICKNLHQHWHGLTCDLIK